MNPTSSNPPSVQSAIWSNHERVPSTPDGFTMRGTLPGSPKGVEVMLEQWRAGASEPPHSHPGDDMTVVVEGRMRIQFYRREGDRLIDDGPAVVLESGQTGYVAAGRIHDAHYLEDCKLVYVHDGVFGFREEA